MPRIVSLIASATEIVHALGFGADQVGRSHECDYPESVRKLPVCTRPRFAVDGDSREIDRLVRETLTTEPSIYEVFDDVLERLAPTHIITQVHCEVCAVSLKDVERSIALRLPHQPRVISLQPDDLVGVHRDIRRIADALDDHKRGEDLVCQMRLRMQHIAALCAGEAGVRIACLEWLEPIMYAGNWMPELIAMANGTPVTLEENPDVVLAMPCGFDLDRTAAEMHWLPPTTARVCYADGNQYFNRPGPRLVESLEILAEIMHPGHVEMKWRGTAWKEWNS